MRPMIDTRTAAQWLLENAVIIDTETTGLDDFDQVVELAAVNAKNGEVLINTLIHCALGSAPEAFALHGISIEMTENTIKTMDGTAADLQAIAGYLGKYLLTSFNQAFDIRLINQSLSEDREPLALEYVTELGHPACIMELANRHFHQHLQWSFERSRFKRLSLKRCCEIAGVEFTGEAHRALPDAIAARDLLVAIAEGRV